MKANDSIFLGEAIPGLPFKRRGKVRDLYDLPGGLLLVTSDRISAFDVVLKEGIPKKGRVLTGISAFWFERTKSVFPNHVITTRVEDIKEIPPSFHDALRGRIILGRKCDVVPFEFIVRGYLTGSGLSEYQKKQSVCGVALPKGLVESSKLPQPILTPTTKAEQGHDMPVTFEEVKKELGDKTANHIADAALKIYKHAADYALQRGIIIADTKFEFGIADGDILLIDELLTPDSSRFWPKDLYQEGKTQPSYDKQIVRDYLNTTGWSKTPPPPPLPTEIVEKAAAKYQEIYTKLTGKEI